MAESVARNLSCAFLLSAVRGSMVTKSACIMPTCERLTASRCREPSRPHRRTSRLPLRNVPGYALPWESAGSLFRRCEYLGTTRRGFRNASDMIAIGVSRFAQKYHDLKEPWAIHDVGARERTNREKAMCRNVWLLCNLREMKRYENGFRSTRSSSARLLSKITVLTTWSLFYLIDAIWYMNENDYR